MRNKFKALAFLLIGGFSFIVFDANIASAGPADDYCINTYGYVGGHNHDYPSSSLSAMVNYFRGHGYPTMTECFACFDGTDDFMVCSSTVTKTSTSYSAAQKDYRTLKGTSDTSSSSVFTVLYEDTDSPFIYLQNPPAGDISLSLSSQFNKYYPKPAFNQNNGWLLNSKDGKISLNGEEKNNLFYELEISKLTLNRNGKNFASKEELSSYLQNSDFLTKLGFTEEQKKNSLDYFIPKLNATANKNFYYLNILSDNAVNEISKLNIAPAPENLARLYFAVYPTNVEVKANTEFIFPEQQSSPTAFTATETGEFLVQPAMQVFFE